MAKERYERSSVNFGDTRILEERYPALYKLLGEISLDVLSDLQKDGTLKSALKQVRRTKGRDVSELKNILLSQEKFARVKITKSMVSRDDIARTYFGGWIPDDKSKIDDLSAIRSGEQLFLISIDVGTSIEIAEILRRRAGHSVNQPTSSRWDVGTDFPKTKFFLGAEFSPGIYKEGDPPKRVGFFTRHPGFGRFFTEAEYNELKDYLEDLGIILE